MYHFEDSVYTQTELLVWRQPDRPINNVLDIEVLFAFETDRSAPKKLKTREFTSWVRPITATDRTPACAAIVDARETLDYVESNRCLPQDLGITGPWNFQATATVFKDGRFGLRVLERPLFRKPHINHCFAIQLKQDHNLPKNSIVKMASWTTIGMLISCFGKDPTFVSWITVAMFIDSILHDYQPCSWKFMPDRKPYRLQTESLTSPMFPS